MKILGEGRPRRPHRGGATSRLELRDRTNDVARQHDKGRPQGNTNSRAINPVPVDPEHTRWVVLSLVRYVVWDIKPGMGEKGFCGHLDWGFVYGYILVNAKGAQWDCRCIPVNAQGDQWDCGCIPDRACERTGSPVRLYCLWRWTRCPAGLSDWMCMCVRGM